MVKKLLNPIVVSAFILVLVLGSLSHLCYGSCQTSKYLYVVQYYWMDSYLPEWAQSSHSSDFGDFLAPYGSGVREWKTWSRSGNVQSFTSDINDESGHTHKFWYENGAPSKAWCFLLGVSPDLEILPSSEELIRASHS
ncbi:MAG: hypothetical protein COA79_26135, partial [Planctomycetota bacterium]